MSNLNHSQRDVTAGAAWLRSNFDAEIAAAVSGKPYGFEVVCGIACKETGFIWIPRRKTLRAAELLPLLVGDASGDAQNTTRKAYPKNGQVFRNDFGDAFTDMLIDEANKARALRGLRPAKLLYKGYGIFQYDLQHVKKDEVFFKNRLWHGIGPCLERLALELDRKFSASGGDTRDAIRRYNGSGARAEAYADEVMVYVGWCGGL